MGKISFPLKLARPFSNNICLLRIGPKKFLYILHICLYVFARTHTHTYIYMHKHAHTHKFINICIYMYICKETRWKSMSDLESYPPFKLLSTQYILKLNFKIFYFYVQLIFFSGNKISKYRQTVMLYMYSFQQYFS